MLWLIWESTLSTGPSKDRRDELVKQLKEALE